MQTRITGDKAKFPELNSTSVKKVIRKGRFKLWQCIRF